MLVDRVTGLLVVTGGRNVCEVSPEGHVRPLLRAHQRNPLHGPHGLVQAIGAGDMVFLEEDRLPALYRLGRQGLLEHVTSLLSYPIGLAQERETGDLVISRNGNFSRQAEGGFWPSAVVRLSGFSRGSEFELDGWLGCADDPLPR